MLFLEKVTAQKAPNPVTISETRKTNKHFKMLKIHTNQ